MTSEHSDRFSPKRTLPQQSNAHACWRVIAASIQGTSHLQSGTPCQDAFGTRLLSTGDLLVAVADGAGSATAGGMGAQLAVKNALATMEADFAKYRPASRKAWRQLIYHAFAAAQSAIGMHAQAHGQHGRDYAAALVVAVLTTDAGVVCGLIGDCVAVIRCTDGTLRSLCPLQRGEYANATNFLIQPNALDLLDIQLWPEVVKQAAFFSDGLAALAMNLAHNRPHAPFFDPLFAFVENATNPDHATQRLATFLDSARINARTDDDKTLVLIQSCT